VRYLILSDIHSNLDALETVLASANGTWEQVVVLGDLVGYGADPNAVVECVRELAPLAIVRGNHDKVACGLEQADGFNLVARSAARWTLDVLLPQHRDWLAALPAGPIEVDQLVEICHGAPFDEDA
jgi:predicted phosphodiesterase